jgi:hypothetical protein
MPEVDGAEDSAEADRLGGIPVNARPMLNVGCSSPELDTADENVRGCCRKNCF